MNKTIPKNNKNDDISVNIDNLVCFFLIKYDNIVKSYEDIKYDKDTEESLNKIKYHPELNKLTEEKLKVLLFYIET